MEIVVALSLKQYAILRAIDSGYVTYSFGDRTKLTWQALEQTWSTIVDEADDLTTLVLAGLLTAMPYRVTALGKRFLSDIEPPATSKRSTVASARETAKRPRAILLPDRSEDT